MGSDPMDAQKKPAWKTPDFNVNYLKNALFSVAKLMEVNLPAGKSEGVEFAPHLGLRLVLSLAPCHAGGIKLLHSRPWTPDPMDAAMN